MEGVPKLYHKFADVFSKAKAGGLYTAPHILIRLNQTLIWLEHQQFFKSESDQVRLDSEVRPINYLDSDQIFSLGSDQNPSTITLNLDYSYYYF